MNIKKCISIVAVLLLLILSFSFSACVGIRPMDRYLSVFPTDTDYLITASHHLQTSNGDHTHNFKAIRKTITIAGQNRVVIYVEYSFIDGKNSNNNFDRTLMYVENKVLSLEGNSWQVYTDSFGDRWGDIYGPTSGSLTYILTSYIRGRDFPVDLKKTGVGYLEYDFGKDNEVFKISDDIYHLLLFYSFDYNDTHERIESTVNYITPLEEIKYTNTITAQMLA